LQQKQLHNLEDLAAAMSGIKGIKLQIFWRKPPSRWQEVPDWGDKLPRKASVQHYEPCLKHLSSGPPDQENMPTSKSRLHLCFAKRNKKARYNKE
jgi:hypothetical protein